ncbi:MAG: acetyl-CoA acetyltransferase [Gammaproteobacteria bacterium 39-13]|nr:acetyl-CoA C-acyltransferase [Gammaproteobacteria bacterium]OJV85970.1 MAG: acetyl-CoA acetyltransferase [Gammaproteobacteria bacterium 39-13]
MSTQIQDVYIVAAVRTAVGKAKGAFRYTRPDDLLSTVLQSVMAKASQIPLEKIDDVIIGCAMPEAEQGMNVARISALLAGLPENVPAVTINRFCSSGLQAISMAADRVALGMADIVIAGGVESMSMVPLGGYNFSANPRYFEDEHIGIAYGMGITAEKVAQKWKISREEQDAFAFASHQKAVKAIESDAFLEEIISIQTQTSLPDLETMQVKKVIQDVRQDQGPRKDTSLEILAKLRPVFAREGTVTAGNSSQMSDGAAALLVVNERVLAEYDLKPLAKFRGFAVAGVAPEYMGIGPIEAIPKVLKQSGLKLGDIDWVELNEAFAAQSVAVIKTLNISESKVNPLGGAIALGHPLGATGAVLATKLIHGAHKRQQKYGMVTMCIGTGMGAAGLFEML